MGALSIWHLAIVALVVLVIFGAGKIPSVLGDIGKGMREMKKSLTEADDTVKAIKVEAREVETTIRDALHG